MNALRSRLARLTAASVLALGLGALTAGPAFAENPPGWSWRSADNVTLAEDASPDGVGKPGGIRSAVTFAAEDASPDSIGRGSGIKSAVILAAEDDASPDGIGRGGGIK